MTYLPHVLALFGAWVVFIASPGPSFATTVHYATTRSRNEAISDHAPVPDSSPLTALGGAMRSMLSTSYNDPSHWAAFMLTISRLP